MDHVAILRKGKIKKRDNLLANIIAGSKTIESRWYVNRIAPWNKIKVGEWIYFKESGKPVNVKAKISKVIQFENLNESVIKEIINNYGSKIAPNNSIEDNIKWALSQTKKRYCILVFLKNVEQIKPFNINKKGFGISSAWLVTDSIEKLKIKI